MSAPAVPQANPPKWLTPRMRELIEVTMAWPSEAAVFEAMRELSEILPSEDGEPMESPFHSFNIGLLADQLIWHWRGRNNFFTGGNMFFYFSPRRLLTEDFRGPDYFIVRGVRGDVRRTRWITWDEGGRYPDLIIEFNSPSTAHIDLTEKKDLYEQVFRTPEYYCFDPDNHRLIGWHLKCFRYEEQPLNEKGWVWSEVVEAWIGAWEGTYLNLTGTWLRFYDRDGQLLPMHGEYFEMEAEAAKRDAEAAKRDAETAKRDAEAAKQDANTAIDDANAARLRAVAEKQRADAAEAELARLRALLAQQSRPENGAGS